MFTFLRRHIFDFLVLFLASNDAGNDLNSVRFVSLNVIDSSNNSIYVILVPNGSVICLESIGEFCTISVSFAALLVESLKDE
jgi:hypothetical protein